MKKVLFFFFFLTAWSLYSEAQVANEDKHRLIVTTDLGGTDPDDIQSMIHLLLCSNVIDIEGLISSQVWMDDPDKTAKISEVVEQFRGRLSSFNNCTQLIQTGIPFCMFIQARQNFSKLFYYL